MKTTTPDTLTDSARQLRETAANIETYRADLNMPKAVLLRTYPELGTDKTFGKIIKGDFAELDVEGRWLPAWADVWQRIQGAEDDDGDADLITDLTGPVELCRSYLETRNEKGNARFILILADSGMGKTCAVRALRAKPYGNLVFDIEACEIWKNKHGRGTAAPLLRAIGSRIGMKDLPSTRDGLLNAIVTKLQGQRRCLVIEEVHHLCPEGVNTIKSLINLSPVIVVGTAMPILWDKLSGSRNAWAECKQLTGNRLAERVVLTLQPADVTKFLQARLPDLADADWLPKGVIKLTTEAKNYGNMRFVAEVVKRFKREIKAGQDAALDTFANAIATEIKRR
jgi:hypothetical protein